MPTIEYRPIIIHVVYTEAVISWDVYCRGIYIYIYTRARHNKVGDIEAVLVEECVDLGGRERGENECLAIELTPAI